MQRSRLLISWFPVADIVRNRRGSNNSSIAVEPYQSSLFFAIIIRRLVGDCILMLLGHSVDRPHLFNTHVSFQPVIIVFLVEIRHPELPKLGEFLAHINADGTI